MTLWSTTKAALSCLWRISAKALRYALARPTDGHRDRHTEAYLLHRRCCRTEHFFQEHR
jgi:hypothetical protein